RESPVVGRDAEREGEEPWSDGPLAIVAAEVLVNFDEDIVREVLEVARRHAEPPERVVDVIVLGVEESVEKGPGVRTVLGDLRRRGLFRHGLFTNDKGARRRGLR